MGRDHLGDLVVGGRTILKFILNKWEARSCNCSGQTPVASCCEYSNEPSSGERLEQVSDYQLHGRTLDHGIRYFTTLFQM